MSDTNASKAVLSEGADPGGATRGALVTSKRSWQWTKVKRKAVKLVVQGRSDYQIAAELGKHRNTVRKWRHTQEFHAACITEAREYVNRIRYKRVHETGVITDHISAQVAKRLAYLQKTDPDDVTQVDLNHLQLFLREYREFRSQERADFGDDVRRVEGTFNIGGLSSINPDAAAGSAGAQSFKRFVEDNVDKVPERAITGASTAQEALVEATRQLLQSTDILDKIHEEDAVAAGEGDK